MFSVSTMLPPNSYDDNWKPSSRIRLAEHLCNVSHFLRGLRVKMRFGELTRAPISLLRLKIVGEVVNCDWLARSADPWDQDLSSKVRERHLALQTLRDAIDVRALLFDAVPQAETANFRVYRDSSSDTRELIIKGCSQRNDNSSRSLRSLSMRAKILGFRFDLNDGALLKLGADESKPQADPPDRHD